ncbi:bifunctional helix-turn-helix transcriptional regulator/GNAT family N-acetyltransferase [Roseibium litorale]|uniref:MarR family transcriptional regulator n=1 Tax=Roseibium litorale TaxID=2803841 RepID=A0ABR9CHR4_9HYPH|nr:helix-turn-helix domain-containing GNAT family N-acetyltransferase [Roseibium litorale]MBD8890375.1 MarR family transcriptional regulator [Roseibium litorale]
MLNDISRFRRFSRAVTSEVGALDTSFLGRGRPLGAARVLNAIGQGRTDVAAIRAYLALDSGLMSRLLRSLEEEKLIELTADPEDARKRRAVLTPAGEAEFSVYEQLSNERAEKLLGTHAHPQALLEAMDLIASALDRNRWSFEEVDPRSQTARYCLEEYYAELDRRFEGGFQVSLSADPDAESMMRPKGVFFVTMSDGLPVGCVGLKGTDKGYAEIKRLWVSPAARGLGLARKLMAKTEEAAREIGIKVLRLDTNKALPEAVNFYRKEGWTEIDRFNDDPYPDFFFEKIL